MKGVGRRGIQLHDDLRSRRYWELKEKAKDPRRLTQIPDDLRSRRRYWELKEKAKDLEDGNDSLSIEHKKEIQVFFPKSSYLLISSILNDNK